MPERLQPRFDWAASPDRQALAESGWEVVEFDWLVRNVVARSSGRGQRQSLDNPSQDWLDKIAAAARVAVVGVRLTNLPELAALHGYVLEPAWRTETPLLVGSGKRLSTLPHDRFVDPDFDYAYTLERALWVAMRMFRGSEAPPARRAVP